MITRLFCETANLIQPPSPPTRRCRSAFKLLEIDQKCSILRPGQTVIDCGAAPGSWTQIAVAQTNAAATKPNQPVGFVIGLDLLQIYPIAGANILGNTDFTLAESQAKIRTLLGDRRVDCVLSDMAPNATGVRSLDKERITTLCYAVLRFAALMSTANASLLLKVWDNGDIARLEADMLRFYRSVKIIKPQASRADSSEKFLLAREFVGLQEEEEAPQTS